MQIAVLTNESLKEELLSNAYLLNENIHCVNTMGAFYDCNADVYIDLLFEKEHVAILKALLPKLVIINSVEETLVETHTSFVRINGWPTFLKSAVIEASCPDSKIREKAEEVFSLFGKKMEWLPDEVGFITPRIIGMIINEAFIALKEGVSTKEEIDIAMKLGTNYPYGPFEWAEKIGIEKLKSLLKKLSKHQERYNSYIFT